jgi:hypothetical protein
MVKFGGTVNKANFRTGFITKRNVVIWFGPGKAGYRSDRNRSTLAVQQELSGIIAVELWHKHHLDSVNFI